MSDTATGGTSRPPRAMPAFDRELAATAPGASKPGPAEEVAELLNEEVESGQRRRQPR